jgi:hypothetical protein
MSLTRHYDSNLAMGLGLLRETKALLSLWTPPMEGQTLYEEALACGLFPGMTAYRLRNLVVRCFAGRYLTGNPVPAEFIKHALGLLKAPELTQLFFLYTCRANPILHDFVREAFWLSYAAGVKSMSKQVPEEFIRRAIDDGKTPSRWAEGQIERVGRYLSGCCSDFGLLGSPTKDGRPIRSVRLEQSTVACLAYELHFRGIGDNGLLTHEDWQLFGLAREDVLEEIKRLSLRGLLIVQAAGDAIRISWKYSDMEALCDDLAKG